MTASLGAFSQRRKASLPHEIRFLHVRFIHYLLFILSLELPWACSMQTDHLRSHELLLPFLGIKLVTIPLDRNIFAPLALTSNKPDTQRKKQTLLHKFSTLSRRTSRAKYLDQVKMPNRKYGLSVQKKPQGQKKNLALYLFGIACDLSSPNTVRTLQAFCPRIFEHYVFA